MADRFEYIFLDLEKNAETVPDFDEMGAAGYELVTWREIESTGSRDSYQEWIRYYFKKRLPPERKKRARKKKA